MLALRAACFLCKDVFHFYLRLIQPANGWTGRFAEHPMGAA
jgi:hypothetical protein